MRPRRAAVTAALAVLALASAVPARAQFRAGPEFRVNSYTEFQQQRPNLAVEPEGEFVIVWESYGQDGSLRGIFGRSYREDGSPRSPEFRVNSYTTGHQSEPFVAYDGNEFVVAWTTYRQDGSANGVFARRFDKDGTAASGEFAVNQFTTGDQVVTSVAKDRRGSRGGFVVVWTDYGRGSYGDVVARRYDGQGAPLGDEFVVNVVTADFQGDGKVAMAEDGRFAVVWTSFGEDGDRFGIFARRFNADGTPASGDIRVNTLTTEDQVRPAVDVTGDGGFVVVWEQADGSQQGIFGQRFDAGGNRVGADFQINTSTASGQDEPTVATSERGDFVASWRSYHAAGGGGDAFAQRFDSTGARIGGEFRVNSYTTSVQGFPSADADEVGNFTIAWSSFSQDGSGWGVYAQRFGGILFTAIGVDGTATLESDGPLVSDGNGVLEPGETAVVETSWKNVSGVAQTLSGSVLSFTGPAGPTYTVPDPSASFGTIPNGATQSCAVTGDCYVVGVSGTRPVTHWDAVMEEGNNNIILGQAKLWNIHVGDSFTDVPRGSPYYRFIETVLHHKVTGGCTATTYCPLSPTTREQMAVFVVRAASGPLYAPPACGAVPMFGDVPASDPFCPWIEELARRGVVSGCGGGNYCPKAPVTREQMAVFVLRALDGALNPPACGTPMFNDVPASSPFCRWIEELARRGVVSGCGGGNYCPTADVSREQMAVFVTRTFGLLLYGV